MEKHLFLGDEAVAQAAIDAGLSGVYAYPGTPSTEITEFIQGSAVAKERGIHCRCELRRQASSLLYEACGAERCRRLFYECCYERCQWWYDYHYSR